MSHVHNQQKQNVWSQIKGVAVVPIYWHARITQRLGQRVMRFAFDKLVRRLILAAQDVDFTNREKQQRYNAYLKGVELLVECLTNKRKNRNKGTAYAKLIENVKTPDEAILHTIEIYPDENMLNEDIKTRKFIIMANRNADCYQFYANEMIKLAEENHVTVVGFNYRGVAQSTGRINNGIDGLFVDLMTQKNRLIDRGIDPENILIYGRSLGGMIATRVVRDSHENGYGGKKYGFEERNGNTNKAHKVHLLCDRSPANITDAAVGLIRTFGQSGYKEHPAGKVLAWLARPIIKFVLESTGYEVNAVNDYRQIPEDYKDYRILRSSKLRRKVEPTVVDDKIVTHYASLHTALRGERWEQKKLIEAAKGLCQKLWSNMYILKASKQNKKIENKFLKNKADLKIVLDALAENGDAILQTKVTEILQLVNTMCIGNRKDVTMKQGSPENPFYQVNIKLEEIQVYIKQRNKAKKVIVDNKPTGERADNYQILDNHSIESYKLINESNISHWNFFGNFLNSANESGHVEKPSKYTSIARRLDP